MALSLMIAGLLLVAQGFYPPLGLAQGGSPEPHRVEAGPYRLAIITDPSILSLGSVRFKISVHSSESGDPVPDAKVVIQARHEADGTEGWANALNSPSTPELYEAQMELDGPGTWLMSIDVASSLGRVQVAIPSILVPEPRRSTAGALVFIGVLVILLLGGVYLTWTIRRSQQRRQTTNES